MHHSSLLATGSINRKHLCSLRVSLHPFASCCNPMTDQPAESEAPKPSQFEQPVQTFEQLAASRRHWIAQVLRPWCRQATLKQLRQAEVEWLDIAGRVDLNATLWTWAWERFIVLTHPELSGVHETHPVVVNLKDGSVVEGYPDSRKSIRGELIILSRDSVTGTTKDVGPISIDAISHVEILNL